MSRPSCARSLAFVAQSALVAAFTLTTGCASTDPARSGTSVPADARPATATEPLRLAQRFALSGRFLARHDDKQLAGQFSFRTDGNNTLAEVFSPLGTVLARLAIDAQGATLSLADGTITNEASVASLLSRFTGLAIHDDALPHWLRGLPHGRPATRERDRFSEHGWLIEILTREEGEQGAPRRMRWQPLASPESEIVWVLDRWVFD